MLEQEAREIQKELYGSTQDMQMTTTSSQLPRHRKGSPSEQAVSGTSGHTEGALFGSKRSRTGGLLLLPCLYSTPSQGCSVHSNWKKVLEFRVR